MSYAELKLTQGEERWAYVLLGHIQLPLASPLSDKVMRAMANFSFWGRWKSGPNHLKSPDLSFGTSFRTKTKTAQNLGRFWSYSKTTSMLSFIELPEKTKVDDRLSYADYKGGWDEQGVVALTLSNVDVAPKGLALVYKREPEGFVNMGGDVFQTGYLNWGLHPSNHKYY